MSFNYSKLRGKIREVCGTQEKFAKAIGIAPITLSTKLNNKVDFDQQDIVKTCNVLNITTAEIPSYFFAAEV